MVGVFFLVFSVCETPLWPSLTMSSLLGIPAYVGDAKAYIGVMVSRFHLTVVEG